MIFYLVLCGTITLLVLESIDSILEEIPGFSVVRGLPHDIMHDLFEGVVPYELKLLICHCVSSNYFSIEVLNERMNAYDFDLLKLMLELLIAPL